MKRRADAIVMHPGPMNRGIEIESRWPTARVCHYSTGHQRSRRAHGGTRARRQVDGRALITARTQKRAAKSRTLCSSRMAKCCCRRISGRPVHHAHSCAESAAAAASRAVLCTSAATTHCRCAGHCRSCASATTGLRCFTRLSARACACCSQAAGDEVSVLGPIGQPFDVDRAAQHAVDRRRRRYSAHGISRRLPATGRSTGNRWLFWVRRFRFRSTCRHRHRNTMADRAYAARCHCSRAGASRAAYELVRFRGLPSRLRN